MIETATELHARFGRNPFSFFVHYDAPWQLVAGAPYLEHGKTALVWGDPLAEDPAAALDELTRALRRRRICLLLIGEELAAAALAQRYAVLKIGEQPFFDLAGWHVPRGDRGKRLRWTLNLARRAGVEVRPYEPRDEDAVTAALAAWQERKGGRAANSFLRASPLAHAHEKRLFLARNDGRIEAVVACSPAPAANGWLLEDLIRRPDAPNGATEALVVHALGSLAAEGAACAWMDLAPLRGLDAQLDRRARLLFRTLAPAVWTFDRRYRFRALTTYLDKFQPTSWTPRYVALNPALPTPALVRALRALL